ncbi:cytochrome P450 [Cladochytrium replicatum]|nr:cytochrome P450 [Cladochytrium replicatum]
MVERAFVPFPYWDYFKTTSDLEAEQSVTRITQGARSFLQKALSISDQASTMMLQGFMENHRSTTDNLGSDILVENFIGFLVASQDTTATTTFRIMHFLAKHPRVQQQVQREVDGILNGLARIEDLATLDPNEAFKYIHAVVRETNRLDPVSSLTTHSAAQDIQLDGVVIPKGTELLLHNNVSMLKFSNFEDPFEFRPERWFELDSNEHLRKKELQSFMPFSAGPHICPGRHLAMAEILFFTAIMCSEFEISYRPGPSFVNDLATNQFNLPLQIRKRSPSSE